MHTTMNVTGRPAQFGRGVMVEVGGKLVEKFAENLAQQLVPGTGTDAGRVVGASAASPAFEALNRPTGSTGSARQARVAGAAGRMRAHQGESWHWIRAARWFATGGAKRGIYGIR